MIKSLLGSHAVSDSSLTGGSAVSLVHLYNLSMTMLSVPLTFSMHGLPF